MVRVHNQTDRFNAGLHSRAGVDMFAIQRETRITQVKWTHSTRPPEQEAMNHTLRFITLTLALTLVACSGDTGTQTENNDKADTGGGGGGEDTGGGGEDTGGGGGEDTGGGGEDTGGGGGEDAGLTDAGGDTGGVEDAGPEDVGGEDAGTDAMADAEMDAGLVFPDVGEYPCAYPTTDPACATADFGPGSFFEYFQIETDRANGCCRDFDGNGTVDNFIGYTLIPLANGFGGIDVNQNVERAISLGGLVYLLELQGATNDQYDSDVTVALLTGRDTDFDMGPNLAGTGEFYVSPDSYDTNGDPFWGFASASIFDYELVARGGNLEIFFPGLVEEVDLWLSDVELRGLITPGADLAGGGTVEIVDGELSGALDRDRFFQSMNDVANSPICQPCLGQDILTFNQTANRWDCSLQSTVCDDTFGACFRDSDCATGECDFDPGTGTGVCVYDEACQLVGSKQLCDTFALVSRQADLDTDGDNRKDAYSFGARFRGTTTVLRKSP